MPPGTALEQLHDIIDNLEEVLAKDLDLATLDIENIIMCAMGGSAISANIVADCCSGYVGIPISVNRSPMLPGWVGGKTLAILSSYSGNTVETIEMYKRVKERKTPIIVITSGGKLEEMAKEDGFPVMFLPKGLQPRFSVGFMIGYIGAVLSSIGYPQFSERIRPIIGSLKNYRNYLEAPGSVAHLLAEKYKDCVPVICTENKFRSISLRWKGQFNENSKLIAFNGALSEFNYCEANPWSKYKGNRMSLIILVGEDDLQDGGLVKRAVGNIETLGFSFDLVAIAGTSHEERVFRALILGDYVSVYIADARGVDPTDVSVITELKRRIRISDPDYKGEDKQ
jgi:glucose/mannose-6-phosphate isomerase